MSRNRAKPEFNDNDMVVGYYRYSSSSQNEASIEQQQKLVHRWAAPEGLTILREYTDPARTATNTDRPEFQQKIRELPRLKPAYVAVWKNDRLGRNRSTLLKVKGLIRAAGARLHYIEGYSRPGPDPGRGHVGCVRRALMCAAVGQHPTRGPRQRREGAGQRAQDLRFQYRAGQALRAGSPDRAGRGAGVC